MSGTLRARPSDEFVLPLFPVGRSAGKSFVFAFRVCGQPLTFAPLSFPFRSVPFPGQVAAAGELNMLDMVEEFSKRGNQLFVTLKKGKEYPPTCCDVRVQYEQTIMDLRKKVEEATARSARAVVWLAAAAAAVALVAAGHP